MAPKKSNEPSEGDLVATRAAVKLADLQRKVASWLPARTDEERASEQRSEDEEEYETGYELLGVGATPPTKTSGPGGTIKRNDPSLEALRKQLLGRNASTASSSRSGKSAIPHRATVPPAKSAPPTHGRQTNRMNESDSEDDEGRGAMFASKRSKVPLKAIEKDGGAAASEGSDPNDAVDIGKKPTATTQAKPKRKAASYMDEILAAKSAKKKKKKKKGDGE